MGLGFPVCLARGARPYRPFMDEEGQILYLRAQRVWREYRTPEEDE